MSVRVGLIGGGHMGEALVSGLLANGVAEAKDVTVSDIAQERRDLLASRHGVSVVSEAAEAARGAELLVLAVKPQEFSTVADGLRSTLNGSQTVLTIMAGVPIAKVSAALRHEAVARAMPNAAASVGEAMTVWTATAAVSDTGREAVARLLGALGQAVYVDEERYLDMATAVSGSGPGFAFLYLEAFIDAAVNIGLRRELAEELAVQTLVGSAALARETGKHPAELRSMVTSPGGTTAAGLQVLEESGLRGAVIAAVEAAYERAKELGN